MALRWRREAKNKNAPMMMIRGRKLSSSMAARVFRLGVQIVDAGPS